ncbi:MAG: DUF4115 domain-containing protein [Alphaproteobacteria bacterium]|nr:DUF4115 domain-containing protein [Alphaproteobacteria bacterium]
MNYDDVAEAAFEPATEESQPSYRAKPDGATDPAGEAGWFLERERENRRLTLEDAAEATGIHPYHIEAIELGDMTRMPQRLEALEMIGTYAQFLGFDPEPLIRHYAHFLPRPAMAPLRAHPADPPPLSSAKVLPFGRPSRLAFRLNALPGGTGGLVASVAGAVFLFASASWMMMPSEEQLTPAIEVATSTDPMPTASTDSDTANVKVTQQTMPDEEPLASLPADGELEGTGLDGLTALIEGELGADTGTAPEALRPATTETASAETSPAETQDVAAVTQDAASAPDALEPVAKARLVLKAKAPVWVRIEDAQGNVVMTQMLMKGETYNVPDRDGLVVIARDGGLLSYIIDGQEKGILGTPGEILVGRPLDIKLLDGNG